MPGVQAERTVLAWRRTALSAVAAAAAIARLMYGAFGPASLAPLALALAVPLSISVLAIRNLSSRADEVRQGVPFAALSLSALTVALGVSELANVVFGS